MTASVASPAERESARKLFTRLHQAYRGFRLYPADHPSARHALDEFVNSLSVHLDRFGPLGLVVEEDQILFQDQTVYYQEDNRTNLAFMMFRDGIRFLAFQPGIVQEEAEAFVDCLSQADDLASIEYDLTTALWERDLQHIEYEVVDPFLGAGGESLRNDAVGELRETVVRRLGELTPGATTVASPPNPLAAFSSTGGGVVVGARDGEAGQAETEGGEGAEQSEEEQGDAEPGLLDASGITLTQEEIEQGEQAVADLARTTLSDFAVVLLEIAGNPADPPDGEEVLARSLSLVAENYLDNDDMAGFTSIVDRLRTLQEQGRRSVEFGRATIGRAVNAERLIRVIERGDQGPAEEAGSIEGLLARMREWIFPGLLEALAESTDKGVRKAVIALLNMEGGIPVRYLWPLMDDSRWFVVRNAVQLATRSGDPELASRLERLLFHPDERVRREVIRSLDTLPDGNVATLLGRAMSDDDSSVRTLAAHGLARHGGRGQVEVLQQHAQSRDLDTRPSEEVNAVLWAYACLGGEATVGLLGKMWKRRLFGTRSMPVRVAAVQALAAIDSPVARQALQAAAKSGEAQVQRAAARALGTARPANTESSS